MSALKGYKWEIGGAIVGCLAAPIVVPAALGAIGFTSGGIAAGTTAAGIMSSYGGAVTAGSSCAVMQSIGAAGLGATGKILGGGLGAAAGRIFRK